MKFGAVFIKATHFSSSFRSASFPLRFSIISMNHFINSDRLWWFQLVN